MLKVISTGWSSHSNVLNQPASVKTSQNHRCSKVETRFWLVLRARVIPETCLLMSSLSSSCSSSQPSRSVMSSIFFVVALALSSFSNMHFTWYHSFISPADSLKGFGTILPILTMPFGILSLHFLQPAVPRLAYSTRNLCSDMSSGREKHRRRNSQGAEERRRLGLGGIEWKKRVCCESLSAEKLEGSWSAEGKEATLYTKESCWRLTKEPEGCRTKQRVLWIDVRRCLCMNCWLCKWKPKKQTELWLKKESTLSFSQSIMS